MIPEYRMLTLCVGFTIIASGVHGFRQECIAPWNSPIANSHRTRSHDFALFSEKRHKESMLVGLWCAAYKPCRGKSFAQLARPPKSDITGLLAEEGGIPRLYKVSGMPTKRMELPARRCMLLGKMDNTKARQISHSGKRAHRTQKVNLQWKRVWCISRGHYVRLRLSMKGLKTIKRLGLEEAARRFNLNLNNPKLFAGYANLKAK